MQRSIIARLRRFALLNCCLNNLSALSPLASVNPYRYPWRGII